MEENIMISASEVNSLLESSNESLWQAGSPYEIHIFSDDEDDDFPFIVTLGRRDKDPNDSWDEIEAAEDLNEVKDIIFRLIDIYLESDL